MREKVEVGREEEEEEAISFYVSSHFTLLHAIASKLNITMYMYMYTVQVRNYCHTN